MTVAAGRLDQMPDKPKPRIQEPTTISALRSAFRGCRIPLAAVAGLAALCGPALAAAPPAFQAAPGRVVFGPGGASLTATTAAVGLPSGGAVLAGYAKTGSYVAQLTADGELDTSFGRGGIDNLVGLSAPHEVLRQPDGRLIVVGDGPSNPARPPLMVVARLNVDGSLDGSFGVGGVETLGIDNDGPGHPVGLLADGELAVTGGVGTAGLVSATNPTTLSDSQWVVVRLTASGALDPTFGSAGVATLPLTAAQGTDLAIAADGDILTTGLVEVTPANVVEQVARLTPSGALDPSFDGGVPVAVPGVEGDGVVMTDADGSVTLGIANLGGHGALERLTPSGAPDPSFGSAGIAPLPTATRADQPLLTGDLQLLPGSAGGVLAITQEATAPGLRIYRLASDGAVDSTLGGPTGLQVTPAFRGGNRLPLVGTVAPQPVTPLAQSSFTGAIVIPRPDGSYLLAGGVSIVEQTGSGAGRSIAEFAVAALTPAFAPDTMFGGPRTPLRASLTLPSQSAAADHHAHAIRLTLSLSQVGDARIVVRAGGRVVAQSLLPVLATGPAGQRVVLTAFGRRWLVSHPRAALTASVSARDLLANPATASTAGRLG